MNKTDQRPSKKQKELLDFIERFIAENSYGPSYREIMAGCNYSSVATVAVHVNNLVARGLLRKNGRSARSLELAVTSNAAATQASESVKPSDQKWLIAKIEEKFSLVENGQSSQKQIDELYVLVGALKVLGFDAPAQAFMPRLSALKTSYNN